MDIILRYTLLILSVLWTSNSFATTNLCVRFPSGTPVKCVDSSSGGTPTWDAILSPLANQTLNMNSWTTEWDNVGNWTFTGFSQFSITGMNVGIGTTEPLTSNGNVGTVLDVDGGALNAYLTLATKGAGSSNLGGGIEILDTDPLISGGDHRLGQFNFQRQDDVTIGQVSSAFQLYTNFDGNLTDVWDIDSDLHTSIKGNGVDITVTGLNSEIYLDGNNDFLYLERGAINSTDWSIAVDGSASFSTGAVSTDTAGDFWAGNHAFAIYPDGAGSVGNTSWDASGNFTFNNATSNGYVDTATLSHSGNMNISSVSGNVLINQNAGNVGIGSTNPGQRLDVNGTVRATYFYGNGSQLTGISSSQWTGSGTGYLTYSGGNVGIGSVAPGRTLDVVGTIRASSFLGGVYYSTETQVTNTTYSVAATDDVILVDATSNNVTLTLPTAVGITGQSYTVKDWKGKANAKTIKIQTTSSQTIDGATTYTFVSPYQSITVVSDGANWSAT